jgi:hypothetical protein
VAATLQNILVFLMSQQAGGVPVQVVGLTDFNSDGALDILVIIGKGRSAALFVLSGFSGLPIFALPLSS